MSFMSISFLLFLALVVIAYYITPSKYQWVTLLVASYVFYLFAGVKLVGFIVFTTASTYACGLWLGKKNIAFNAELKELGKAAAKEEKNKLKEQYKIQKRSILTLFILANFGILFVLKYFNVISGFSNFVLSFTKSDFRVSSINLFLPLGISFYTFSSIGYIVDVYRDKYAPEKNLAKYALFISFFPQIIQGPVARYDDLVTQLFESRKFDFSRIRSGAELMLWGYFKKMVIADRLTIMNTAILSNPQEYPGMWLVVASPLSWIELYMDFSGGIDIARGVAEMLGIELAENFKRPFFADSLPEFWRRWHMSLNDWWRDYIFYPMTLSKPLTKLGQKCRKIFGANFGKKVPIMLSLLVVRVINSFWHGANCVYLIGGLYHGILVALSFSLEDVIKKITRKLKINTECLSWKVIRVLRTFWIVFLVRPFYKATNWSEVKIAVSSVFKTFNPWILFDGSLYTLGVTEKQFHVVLIALLIVLIVSLCQEKGYQMREVLHKQNLVVRWMIYLVGIYSIIIFGAYGMGYDAASFTYMNF
ncbi:MAG: MBOAT family protein [Roseburia sp.]|nr:MBOAT family protein [Roseburia sp.]